jgi:dephospho-CoA kinase
MTSSPPILKVGLTGGIAAGKSTVAAIFRALGAFVVDADDIARRLMAPGESIHREVVERFGDAILDDDGAIERKKLADMVFHDPRARSHLNAIVHPAVRGEADRLMDRCARSGRSKVAIYDAALLVETGAYRDLDRLIVVRCSPETQLRRLELRDGIDSDDATARLASQASLEDKIAAADYVIDTDGSLEETRSQTVRVYEELLALTP